MDNQTKKLQNKKKIIGFVKYVTMYRLIYSRTFDYPNCTPNCSIRVFDLFMSIRVLHVLLEQLITHV